MSGYTTAKKADIFYPHDFKSKVVYHSIPRICISAKAYNDMYILVDEADEEISWLGTVRRDGLTYHIEEIFLLNQECSYSQTELNLEAIAALGHEILLKPDGLKKVNSLRFWGHSHHTMGTSPSGQDETQLKVFIGDDCEYAIRGIFNKSGRMEFTMFFQNGIEIQDVPWMVQFQFAEKNREDWKKEIKEKVKATKYEPYDWRKENQYGEKYTRKDGAVIYPKTHGRYCRCIDCMDTKRNRYNKILEKTAGLDADTKKVIASTMGLDDFETERMIY